MKETLRRLYGLFDRREKIQCLFLIGMMAVGAGLELLGIGLIMPIIAALTKPELLAQNVFLRTFREMFPAGDDGAFVLTAATAVFLVYLGKNSYLLYLTRRLDVFAFGKAEGLAVRLFDAYLRAPYTFYLQRHSTECIANIGRLSGGLGHVLLPLLGMASELVVVSGMFLALLYFAPGMGSALALAAAFLSWVLYRSLRGSNRRYGDVVVRAGNEVLKTVGSALGGIKEIKVLNREAFFSARHAEAQRAEKRTLARANVVAQLPRYAIEVATVALVMGLLAASVFTGVADGTILLRFSLLALMAFRLMPSLSRIHYGLATLRQQASALERILTDLELAPEAGTEGKAGRPLVFGQCLETVDLVFRYPGMAAPLLSGVSLKVPRNSSIAFVGATGCGKTTLADLLLGLLEPEAGSVRVDGRDIRENLPSWQRQIGYVPQQIYLFDDTVTANVAFGIPPEEVDDARVEEALRIAQAWEVVSALPSGTRTVVGEGGVRLSGGQRQRIGIARALYHRPAVLVLDEATSALDADTEQALVDALGVLRGRLTIVVIAHRLATVRGCDQIIRLGDAGVERITAEELASPRRGTDIFSPGAGAARPTAPNHAEGGA